MPEPQLHVMCDARLGSLRLRLDESLRARWTVIFGPSGSGKSSLLRLLSGLWQPRDARVEFSGRDLTSVPAHRRSVGLAAQQPALFPHLSVRQNLLFGAERKFSRDESDALLTEFGLAHAGEQRVQALSGGEGKRLALARALLRQTPLLLLDEVFGGLDGNSQRSMIALLKRRLRDGQSPAQIVSVTHDVGEVFACADEVIRLQEGRVMARGTPAEVLAEERKALVRMLGEVRPS